MSEELEHRKRLIVAAVEDLCERNNAPPMYREISDETGIPVPTVHRLCLWLWCDQQIARVDWHRGGGGFSACSMRTAAHFGGDVV